LILEVGYDDGDEIVAVHPVIIEDGAERVLVDCGYPGGLPELERAAESAGAPICGLTSVIVTHHDFDHCGALGEIRQKYSRVRVMASELDAPYIDGSRKSLRLEQADARASMLTPEERIGEEAFRRTVESVRPVGVDVLLHDGDTFPWCGGTEIIATPGHMPGHISVLLRRHRTLITGDALVAIKGRLRLANPHYAIDLGMARESVKKLAAYDIETFICYHGGPIETRLSDGVNRHFFR
jgi:glyoxylase-like metal-dependent hydrolase (beta-lactamase superfamily II)